MELISTAKSFKLPLKEKIPMLKHPTLDKLQTLKFTGMAAALALRTPGLSARRW